jgi:hypothetical protein
MTLLIEAGASLNGDLDENIPWASRGMGPHTPDMPTPDWQNQFFRGILFKAGSQSVNTVALGIELAKALIDGRDSIRMLTFQTLVETAIGASHLIRNGFSSSQGSNIQQTAREIAKEYGLLKPKGDILTGNFAWLDQLWDMTETPSTDGVSIRTRLFANNRSQPGGIVGDVMRSMGELSQGDDRELSDLKMLQMSDRLLKSAITIGGWRSSLVEWYVGSLLLDRMSSPKCFDRLNTRSLTHQNTI